jgi:hypothetical protein
MINQKLKKFSTLKKYEYTQAEKNWRHISPEVEGL